MAIVYITKTAEDMPWIQWFTFGPIMMFYILLADPSLYELSLPQLFKSYFNLFVVVMTHYHANGIFADSSSSFAFSLPPCFPLAAYVQKSMFCHSNGISNN